MNKRKMLRNTLGQGFYETYLSLSLIDILEDIEVRMARAVGELGKLVSGAWCSIKIAEWLAMSISMVEYLFHLLSRTYFDKFCSTCLSVACTDTG